MDPAPEKIPVRRRNLRSGPQFPAAPMRFLSDLQANNNTTWFAANRGRYDEDVVAPLKTFIATLAPRLRALNPSLDVSYKVNPTVMRINRDQRFAPGEPYRGYIKCSFPVAGYKWST